MGTDDLFKKRRKDIDRKESKIKEERGETWLFVCEGEATEPNYIRSLLDYANSKQKKNVGRKIKFQIKGEGKNTESLVNSVDNFFTFVDKQTRCANIRYGKIFVVFDKDSFLDGKFNQAIKKASKKNYEVLWSNECIELWFLLHFYFLDSNVSRQEYFKKLETYFDCAYKKADTDIFNKLNSEVNIKKAVKNAKKLYQGYPVKTSYAKMAPCTMMFKLIEIIEEYLKIKL